MNAFTALGVSAALTDIHETAGDREADPDPGGFPFLPFSRGRMSSAVPRQVRARRLPTCCPVIQRVDTEKNTTQVLIMTPTRELSRQIFDVLRPFAIKLDIDAADIIGGRTIENQLRKLKRDPASLSALLAVFSTISEEEASICPM